MYKLPHRSQDAPVPYFNMFSIKTVKLADLFRKADRYKEVRFMNLRRARE